MVFILKVEFDLKTFTHKPLIQRIVIVFHPFDIGRNDRLDVVGRSLGFLKKRHFGLHKLLDLSLNRS